MFQSMAALERLRIGMICAKARTDTIALVERVNDLRSDFGVIVAVPERSGRRLFLAQKEPFTLRRSELHLSIRCVTTKKPKLKTYFNSKRVAERGRITLNAHVPFLLACCWGLICFGCRRESDESSDKLRHEVVVYSSTDDVYARPIAEIFTKRTGIQVKLVSDSEETKSTGLLNRLIAEKARPRADVFWSGDTVRAAVLKTKGISTPYRSPQAQGSREEFSDSETHYTAFSARIRVIVFNKNLLGNGLPPKSIFDFWDPRFAGKACIANPLFGTTSMHAAALFQVLGKEKAREFFAGLLINRVKMLSSNGEVRRRVAAGDFLIGLTDSDDVNVAIKDGQPVGFVLPDQNGFGTLVVPSAAVLIAHAPNATNGKKFIDFLLSEEVERLLAESDAAQIPLHSGIPPPKLFAKSFQDIRKMKLDYTKLASQLEELSNGFLKEWVEQQSGK